MLFMFGIEKGPKNHAQIERIHLAEIPFANTCAFQDLWSLSLIRCHDKPPMCMVMSHAMSCGNLASSCCLMPASIKTWGCPVLLTALKDWEKTSIYASCRAS